MLIFGGCSGNKEQSESTGSDTVGALSVSVADIEAVQSDSGESSAALNEEAVQDIEITTSEEETNIPDEGAAIPEEWHRTLV